MKKTLLYSMAALASIALASCTGDYDDWASPQSYPQEDAASPGGCRGRLRRDRGGWG